MSDGKKTAALTAAVLRLASDERLVEQVRAGSERAFEVVYDRHHRGILGFCRHMLGSVEEAEDAVQHTFMGAFCDLEGSTRAIQLRPWLYAIARNRCLSVLRARREHPVAGVEAPATENLSAEVERRQDLRDLLGDVAGLPEDQRAALVLAEVGAVAHEEIAVVLGVPRERVKALVFQARTSLTASRLARDTPCTEIREQLAILRGGALRRSTLRRHLRECAGCREFRDEVKAQRRALAVILPVVPTLALKDAVLAAVFGSAAGGGGAIVAAGGGAFAAKALVAVALVGGGTAAGVQATREAARPDRATARPPVGVRLAAPAVGVERVAEPRAGALGRRERAEDDDGTRRRAERRRGGRVPAGAQPAGEQRAREDTAHRKRPRDERGSDKHAGKELGSEKHAGEKHAGEKRAGEEHEDRPSQQRSRDNGAAPPVAAPTPEPAAKNKSKSKDAPAATGEDDGEDDDEDEDEDA